MTANSGKLDTRCTQRYATSTWIICEVQHTPKRLLHRKTSIKKRLLNIHLQYALFGYNDKCCIKCSEI